MLVFFLHIDIYLLLKHANSDTENGLKKIKNSYAAEKTLFERHQNNTAWLDYLTVKVFISKRPAS